MLRAVAAGVRSPVFKYGTASCSHKYARSEEFFLQGPELKYRCQCEGSDCPNTYCASSQCYSVASGDECSAPCSPKVTEPNCPQGTFAVFKKSYPFCPQNSVRFSCEHFDRCEPYGGEGVHTSQLKDGTSKGPDKRLLSRKNGASTQRGSGLLLMVMTFICYLAI